MSPNVSGDRPTFTTYLIPSMFFVGATFGLLTSTALYDKFGRKNGSLLGSLISFVATISGNYTRSFVHPRGYNENPTMRLKTIIPSPIFLILPISGMFVVNYEMLIGLRFIQGFGQLICWTGVYCWLLEFSPAHLRNSCSGAILLQWAVGYMGLVGASYFIFNWRYFAMLQLQYWLGVHLAASSH